MTRNDFADMLIERFTNSIRKNLADFDYAEETDDPHKFLVFKGGDVLFAEINSPHEPIVIFRKATVMEPVSNLNRK
jgi:hypothetical protein